MALETGTQQDPLAGEPGWNPALRFLPVPGIRRMVNLAATMDDVIHLSIGQPDFPTPPHILERHIEALRSGCTGYTLDAGLPELLEALATYYGERYGRPLSADNLLVTTGATEALYLALSAVAGPGREFILPEPTFPLYAPIIRLHGGVVRPIRTHAHDGYQPDPQQLIEAMGPRTAAVVLNSPGNPTGTVYPRETVEAVTQEAARRGVQVIADEVYDHLLLDPIEYPSVARHADLDHAMVISSFSKTFSMPGLRVGWILAGKGTIERLRRYHIFTTTVANTPAQWAGVAALTGDRRFLDHTLAEYRRRRDRVMQHVQDCPGLRACPPQGAFFVLLSLPAGSDGGQVAMQLLRETGVCLVPGDTFGEHVADTLRLSFSTSMAQIDEAFRRMRPWFAHHFGASTDDEHGGGPWTKTLAE